MIRWCKIVALCLAVCCSLPLSAMQWDIEGSIPSDVLTEAREKFQSLDSSQRITQLLKFLGRKLSSVAGVEADVVGDRVLIAVQQGVFVKRVSIYGENLDLKRPLRVAMQDFHGRLFDLRLQQAILSTARRVVEESGYFRAVLDMDFDPATRVVSLSVEPKKPCIVHGLSGLKSEDEAYFNALQLVGEVCNVKELERSVARELRKLSNSGYFYQNVKIKDVRYFAGTNSAEIQFSGSLGTRAQFRIRESGAFGWFRELISGDLYEGLERIGVAPKDVGKEIEKRLKLQGYMEATTQYEQRDDGEKTSHIYYVKRGPRYSVRDLELRGLGSYSDKKARSDLGVQDLLSRRIYLSEERLESGSESLESALRQDGYWQALVRRPKIESLDANRKSARVIYDVSLGPLYIYAGRRIHLKSSHELSDKILEKIKKIKTARLGARVQEAHRSELQAQIFKLLRDQGYLYAEVKIEIGEDIPEYHKDVVSQKDGQPVFFEIEVKPNKRVRIGSVRIQGLGLTSSHVVEREFLFSSGEYYSQRKINLTRRNLQSLGIFTNVRIQLEDPDMVKRSASVSITVDLQEVLPGSVSFGPGWSRLDGTRFQAEASYVNLGGTNRQYFLRGGVSEERRQEAIRPSSFLGRNLSAGYTEPWFLGTPIDMLVTASHRGTARDFWTLDYIGELAARYRVRRFVDDTTVTAFVRQKIAREIGTNTLNQLLVSSGNVRISSYGLRLRTDQRDDRSWPTKGFLFEGQMALARDFFGGNTTYGHYDILFSGYVPLAKKVVLAMHINATHFNSVERVDDAANVLPSAERAYLGGADTVRGFRERSLGPYVNGVDADFGASHRNVLKLEARYRLFNPVGITAFMDFGNLYFSENEEAELAVALGQNGSVLGGNQRTGWHEMIQSPESIWKDQYVSYGLALSAITPLGSLNLAYGIPVKAPDDVDCRSDGSNCPEKDMNLLMRGRFHLNFGVLF